MNKQFLIIPLLIFIFFAFQPLKSNSETLQTNNNDYIFINNKKIILSVADTPSKRIQGLMHINEIPENKGMVFLFKKPESKAFWMKNMKISIDMLFIYKNKLVKIYKSVPVCSENPCPVYDSNYKIDSVVELKQGTCDKYNINIGDKIRYSRNINALWAKLPE